MDVAQQVSQVLGGLLANNVALMGFQVDSIARMFQREQQNQSVILANDGGGSLSKILEVIGLCVYSRMPTLILCPKYLTSSWRGKFMELFPGVLEVRVIETRHDAEREIVTGSKLVIIAATSILRSGVSGLPGIMGNHQWGRLVIDEGHSMHHNQAIGWHQLASEIPADNKLIIGRRPANVDDSSIYAMLLGIDVDAGQLDALINALVI